MIQTVNGPAIGRACGRSEYVVARWLKASVLLVLLEFIVFVPIAAPERGRAVAHDGAVTPAPSAARAEAHRKMVFEERQKRWQEAREQARAKRDAVTPRSASSD